MPWIMGVFVVLIIGLMVADRWGAEMHQGTATVIEHDYEDEYTSCDSKGYCTTYDEEFILKVQYEDSIISDQVRQHIWEAVEDGEKVSIDYYYGNLFGTLNVDVTGVK